MDAFDIKPLFDWLQIHPLLAGLIAYLISFFECLMILGLFIPGTVFMTAMGTLIGIGVLPFTSITLWAIAGAITGDVLSFWVGRHYHEQTATLWPFHRYPTLLQKGKAFFDRHGGKSIFVGRFIGPIRAVLPLIAGMVHMPYRQFLIADIISAIAWAPIYMLPGILLGQASQALPPDIAMKLIFFVVLLLLFFWLLYSVVRSCYAWFSRLLDKQVAYLWRFTRHHPRLKTLSSCLMDPHHPQAHTQLALALICIFSLAAFLLITMSVAHHGIACQLNQPIYHLMRSIRQVTLDQFFVGITELSPRVLFGFWTVIFAILLFTRNRWAALHWGVLGLLSFGLGDSIKYLMHISRPSGLIKTPDGASFPSGHTISSLSLLGFFALLTAHGFSKKYLRMLVYGSTLFLVFLVIFSRVYLTAHWLSDVVAGILLSISIIASLTLSYRRKRQCHTYPMSRLGAIGVIVLIILWSYNFLHEYPRQLQDYQLYTPPTQTLSMSAWWQHAKQQKPLYLIDRLGRPVGVLNIQWAEKLPTIQDYLKENGWHIFYKTGFLTTLYYLSLRQHHPFTPVSIASHNGQKPALTMVKYFSDMHSLLVLELWPASTQLSSGPPLWSGLVRYQKTWRLQFQPVSKQYPTQLVSADHVLQKELQHYRVQAVASASPPASILFIKPHRIHDTRVHP